MALLGKCLLTPVVYILSLQTRRVYRREPKDIIYSTMQEGSLCCYVVCHGSVVLKLVICWHQTVSVITFKLGGEVSLTKIRYVCCLNIVKYLCCLKLAMKCC